MFDNHYDEIKDVNGYKEFHQKKVYLKTLEEVERFLRFHCRSEKPYKDQIGDAKKKPKRNKTRKSTI